MCLPNELWVTIVEQSGNLAALARVNRQLSMVVRAFQTPELLATAPSAMEVCRWIGSSDFQASTLIKLQLKRLASKDGSLEFSSTVDSDYLSGDIDRQIEQVGYDCWLQGNSRQPLQLNKTWVRLYFAVIATRLTSLPLRNLSKLNRLSLVGTSLTICSPKQALVLELGRQIQELCVETQVYNANYTNKFLMESYEIEQVTKIRIVRNELQQLHRWMQRKSYYDDSTLVTKHSQMLQAIKPKLSAIYYPSLTLDTQPEQYLFIPLAGSTVQPTQLGSGLQTAELDREVKSPEPLVRVEHVHLPRRIKLQQRTGQRQGNRQGKRQAKWKKSHR